MADAAPEVEGSRGKVELADLPAAAWADKPYPLRPEGREGARKLHLVVVVVGHVARADEVKIEPAVLYAAGEGGYFSLPLAPAHAETRAVGKAALAGAFHHVQNKAVLDRLFSHVHLSSTFRGQTRVMGGLYLPPWSTIDYHFTQENIPGKSEAPDLRDHDNPDVSRDLC